MRSVGTEYGLVLRDWKDDGDEEGCGMVRLKVDSLDEVGIMTVNL